MGILFVFCAAVVMFMTVITGVNIDKHLYGQAAACGLTAITFSIWSGVAVSKYLDRN